MSDEIEQSVFSFFSQALFKGLLYLLPEISAIQYSYSPLKTYSRLNPTYILKAPLVIPRINCFDTKKKTITSGKLDITYPASAGPELRV